MVTAAERPLALTAQFLADLSAWTWIDSTPEGLVGFLLIAHPQAVEGEMAALAAALGMATPDRAMPELRGVLACTTTDALVTVPGCATGLLVPTASGWGRFARDGGPIVFLVTGTPMARDADLSAVVGHLVADLLPGTLWLGKTVLTEETP